MSSQLKVSTLMLSEKIWRGKKTAKKSLPLSGSENGYIMSSNSFSVHRICFPNHIFSRCCLQIYSVLFSSPWVAWKLPVSNLRVNRDAAKKKKKLGADSEPTPWLRHQLFSIHETNTNLNIILLAFYVSDQQNLFSINKNLKNVFWAMFLYALYL